MMEKMTRFMSMVFITATYEEQANQFCNRFRKIAGEKNPAFEILTFDQLLDWHAATNSDTHKLIQEHLSSGIPKADIPARVYMAAIRIYLEAVFREKGHTVKAFILSGFPWNEDQRTLLLECYPDATPFPLMHSDTQLSDSDLSHVILEFIEHMNLPPGSSEIRKLLHMNWHRWADQIPGSTHDRDQRRKTAGVTAMIGQSKRHWESALPQLAVPA